jgi:methylated-DNA-[protein]-cysteine S-methyltransferase
MTDPVNYYGYLESPIGWVEIVGTKESILKLKFVEEPCRKQFTSPCLDLALEQVSEYFRGDRCIFNLPLVMGGTDFQRNVWEHVMRIPYGHTTTYQKIADSMGRPRTTRAVGAANGKNPLTILVPCHRVIGSNGNLTGYGGGMWRKKWLLKHEGFLET